MLPWLCRPPCLPVDYFADQTRAHAIEFSGRELAGNGIDLPDFFDLFWRQFVTASAFIGISCAMQDLVLGVFKRGLPEDMMGMNATAFPIPAIMRGLVLRRWRRPMHLFAHPAVSIEKFAIKAECPVPVCAAAERPNQASIARKLNMSSQELDTFTI